MYRLRGSALQQGSKNKARRGQGDAPIPCGGVILTRVESYEPSRAAWIVGLLNWDMRSIDQAQRLRQTSR